MDTIAQRQVAAQRRAVRQGHTARRGRAATQRGAALITAIVLLLIVTLLATTGMRMSSAEITMAGNEQFHRQAGDAASAGVEVAIARLASHPAGRGSQYAIADSTVSGEFVATVRFAGEERSLPGFSAGKFSALHFEIQSRGEASRNAKDEQLQGVMLVNSTGAVETFARRARGLEGAAP